MARIAALGDPHRIEPLTVAGVDAYAATTDEQVAAAWAELPADVAVLVVTAEAAAALGSRFAERRDLLVTVLP